jgi:hypothetical protein
MLPRTRTHANLHTRRTLLVSSLDFESKPPGLLLPRVTTSRSKIRAEQKAILPIGHVSVAAKGEESVTRDVPNVVDVSSESKEPGKSVNANGLVKLQRPGLIASPV